MLTPEHMDETSADPYLRPPLSLAMFLVPDTPVAIFVPTMFVPKVPTVPGSGEGPGPLRRQKPGFSREAL